jgi:hypothetical protein
MLFEKKHAGLEKLPTMLININIKEIHFVIITSIHDI